MSLQGKMNALTGIKAISVNTAVFVLWEKNVNTVAEAQAQEDLRDHLI